MDLPFYHINEKIYPRMTLILDVLNPGFGLMKYKIMKALEAHDELGHPDLDGEIDGVKTFDAVIEESKKEVKAAAANGTRVHEMLEEYVAHGGILDNSPEAKGYINWEKKYKPKSLETEQTVFHPELGFAGTLDRLCEIDREVWLIDYKTSNKLYPKNGIQLTGYAMAKERISNIKIDHIGCLQLGKNKKGFYFKEYQRQDDILEMLVKLFNWSNPNFVKNQEKALKSIIESDSTFKSFTIPVENL